MYPSSFFKFKKLVDQREIENNTSISINSNNSNNTHNNDNNGISNQNTYTDYDSVSITNNLEEFKSLFKTQEKACYELRSENTILKMKLEVANEMIRNQSKKIKSLKLKKNHLEIENNVYKNVMRGSSLLFNNNHNHNGSGNHNHESGNKCINNEGHISHAYPPPPPPPLPLPPSNKIKVNGNFQMNNVLDELKSKIKKIDE
jgi:hypothetical protein